MVRKATEEDIQSILQIISKNPDTLLPRTIKEIRDLLPNFWIALHEGRIVGCCCLEVYSPKIAEIRTLAVEEEYRSIGLGSALVTAAVEEAEKRQVREIMVVTSTPTFFEKLNFGPCLHEKYALFYRGTARSPGNQSNNKV